LRELAELDLERAKEYAEFGQNLAQTLSRFPVVTVAALQAPAFGGGVELALACDFRLATPRTVIHYQAAKLGLLPGWGGTQRLPQLIGRSRSKAMMIMCEPIDANRALDWGLVDAVSDGSDLTTLIAQWNDTLVTMARHSTIQIKRALNLGAQGDFAGEREAFAACFAHGEPQTLIRRWLARQQPATDGAS
jgi:enoyl-CoA hydratase